MMCTVCQKNMYASSGALNEVCVEAFMNVKCSNFEGW